MNAINNLCSFWGTIQIWLPITRLVLLTSITNLSFSSVRRNDSSHR